MSTNPFKKSLLATTVFVGAAALGAPAFAQSTPSAASPAVTQEASPDAQNDSNAGAGEGTGDIVVTGTLIRNPNLQASAPVAVIGQEEVQLKQATVAEELLRELPGAVPSIGSAVNNGNGGQSFVNLRGIGENRNIVLLDGNRIVPGNLTGLVDLNNIPLALIERTEVLTGGASTTYGADAIGGVVNFITRRDFTGMEAEVSEQITERGDGNRLRADLTVGGNFADDKGNAVFSVGYQEVDPVYQGDRAFSERALESFDVNFLAGSGTSVPSTFSGTRPVLAGGGFNTTAPFTQTGVDADGNPILAANPAGGSNSGNRQLNAAGIAVAPYAPYNFNPLNIFQTPFKRFNIFGQARYEVADDIEVYTRGLFSQNTVKTIVAESGSFASAVQIPLSNPYLPAGLRQQFCAFNVAPNVVGVDANGDPISGQIGYTPRFTPAECSAAAAATSPTLADGSVNPAFKTVTVNLSRRAVEVGPRISDFRTQVFDYQAGIRGKVTDSINFDLVGAYGESENRQTLQNYVLTSRLRSALFATNTTSCLQGATGGAAIDAGTGCVPVNVFGAAGSIAPAQIPYLTGDSTTTVATSLAQIRGTFNGDFGVTSPFATDPIGFAVGGEYRKYTASQRSDTLAQTAGELGGAGGAAPNIDGAYDVREGFGELQIPLVQSRPFFEQLVLEAGVRYSSYQVDAPGNPTYKTTTYKGGLQWSPGYGLKFRGNYARAVRAPNIGELFAPLNTVLTNLATDPCAGAAPVANANLRAICLAQGAPAGQIGAIENPTSGQANVTSGGNPNLRPEKADTYTFGVVFQPDFVRGLAISVDYFNIKVKGAVSTPTPGDIIAACFGGDPANPPAGAANTAACTSIGRDPLTGALSGDPATTSGLAQPLSNLGLIKNDGVDLTVNYRRSLGFAALSLGFVGTYNRNSKFQATPTSVDRDCVGFYSVNCGSIQPKFQFSQRTTLSVGDVDFSLLWRFLSKERYEPLQFADELAAAVAGGCTDPQGADPDGCVVDPQFRKIKAAHYFDLAARYPVGDNFTFTVTVANLFDRKPPIVGYDLGSTTFNSGNTYPSTYDALGRRFAVSANVRF